MINLLAALVLSAHAEVPLIQKPAPRESAQALPGQNYTVVAPIFIGENGNNTFLRFGNVNSFATTTTVTIVGTPTGRVYGTVTVGSPAHSSPQYSWTEIMSGAGLPTSLQSGDTGLSFYLQSSSDLTGFQHIIFNGGNGFFENMSLCTWDPAFDYTGLHQIVGNAHTTRLGAYPSVLFIHHYGATAARYRADVFEGRTGAFKGAFTFEMAANESYAIGSEWYEQGANWSPAGGENHMNVLFTRDDGGSYQALVGQAVFNPTLAAYVNMTQFCGINR